MTVERGRQPRRVSYHQKAAAGLRDQIAGERENVICGRLIEIAGGFVGEQKQRPDRQRAADRDPLLLAAGQLLGIAVQKAAEPQSFHQLGMPGRIVAAGDARLERQVIPHIEARDQIELLKYQTEPVAPQCRQAGIGEIGNGRVGEPDLAAVGAIEARDQMQERTLAAAGFAGQRDPLACRDVRFTPRSTTICSPAER